MNNKIIKQSVLSRGLYAFFTHKYKLPSSIENMIMTRPLKSYKKKIIFPLYSLYANRSAIDFVCGCLSHNLY